MAKNKFRPSDLNLLEQLVEAEHKLAEVQDKYNDQLSKTIALRKKLARSWGYDYTDKSNILEISNEFINENDEIFQSNQSHLSWIVDQLVADPGFYKNISTKEKQKLTNPKLANTLNLILHKFYCHSKLLEGDENSRLNCIENIAKELDGLDKLAASALRWALRNRVSQLQRESKVQKSTKDEDIDIEALTNKEDNS